MASPSEMASWHDPGFQGNLQGRQESTHKSIKLPKMRY